MDSTYNWKYRGKKEYAHVPDGQRKVVGQHVAIKAEVLIEMSAVGPTDVLHPKPICPGCYMPVMVNALVELAARNGQSLEELARTMVREFSRKLEANDFCPIEDIHVEDC